MLRRRAFYLKTASGKFGRCVKKSSSHKTKNPRLFARRGLVLSVFVVFALSVIAIPFAVIAMTLAVGLFVVMSIVVVVVVMCVFALITFVVFG